MAVVLLWGDPCASLHELQALSLWGCEGGGSVLSRICHGCRFDSWAGMALARASRIQDKLNSNELKSDGPIWKHATPVLNCFRRALEIDSSNLSLWIEFGTMSYALHSFASRQLKQWRPELPPELVQQVRGCFPPIRPMPRWQPHCGWCQCVLVLHCGSSCPISPSDSFSFSFPRRIWSTGVVPELSLQDIDVEKHPLGRLMGAPVSKHALLLWAAGSALARAWRPRPSPPLALR